MILYINVVEEMVDRLVTKPILHVFVPIEHLVAKVMRKITEALVKINSIENQADDILDFSIERLFNTESDAKEVIKKRDIYQVMEIVTDKCEDASNVIESIIIKYA